MASAPTLPTPAERRERAARALTPSSSSPPSAAVPGWEFTPIDKLDLDAFPPAPRRRRRPSTLFDFDRARRDGRAPRSRPSEGPVVMPLALAAERHPDLVERAPRHGRHAAHAVHRAQRRALDRRRVRLRPARRRRSRRRSSSRRVHEQAGNALHWRALVVLEEGAEAEVWHQALASTAEADGVVNGVVELVVGQNASLRFVDAQDARREARGSSARSARPSRATARSTGSRSASARRNGKVFQETKLAGPGAHGTVTGAYATRGRQHLDFDTLQEHAAPDTTSRPRLPRHPRPTARARCGAG